MGKFDNYWGEKYVDDRTPYQPTLYGKGCSLALFLPSQCPPTQHVHGFWAPKATLRFFGGLTNVVTVETSRLQCAGMNRHEAEDERALRVKTSDLLGPESCADTARDSVKRRQGLGEVGIQLRKDAIRTPPSL
jgi:hypothetical protein